jgi:mono/diheme cytochrome c family protein
VPNPPTAQVSGSDPVSLGKAIAQVSCAVCHSFTSGQASPIAQAPNLGKYGSEGPLNSENKAAKAAAGSSDQWLVDWESHAPKIKPGILMPSFAKADGGTLDPDQINALVAYLKSLK